MPRVLVDTDILSDVLRAKNEGVMRRARAYLKENEHLSISAVTVFEVVRGRYQANQVDRALQFLAWTAAAEVIPFDAECARQGGEMAGVLLRSGAMLGVADILIAATAIVHGAALATANVRHYERLTTFGLMIENWRD
jgi:tRNA(fMet)-specific endonuclease VapC